jgi:anti-sigma regulatory factor (Ser/Thr protein kinase)
VPDLAAKLAGEQTPRGWGLFLIKNLVDDLHVRSTQTQRTIDLILYREG